MFTQDDLVLEDVLCFVSEEEKVYKEKDLSFLRLLSREAQGLWDLLAKDYMDANPRDGLGWGSCVVGEGFYVYYVPRGKRNPRKLFLAKSWGAASLGSLPWESCIEEMEYFFTNHGVKAHFTYGKID